MASPYRAPEDPEREEPAVAHREGMGDLRSTHMQGRGMRAAFAVAVVVVVSAVLASFTTHHAAPFMLGVGVLFALLPIWLFSELLVGLGSAVEVWDEGIVVRRTWTDPAEIRFEDVDAVYIDFEVAVHLGVRSTPTAKVTLTTHGGRRVVIPRGLRAAGDILAAIDRNVERPLLAPARQALAAGEPMTFGPVVLDGAGVTLGGETLEWEAIERIDAEPDVLTIHKKGSRWRVVDVPVRELPHPRVLVLLLASRVKVAVPSGTWVE
jgi:hypothetical protein